MRKKKNQKKNNELKSDYSQVEHASFWFAMYDLRNLKIKLAKILVVGTTETCLFSLYKTGLNISNIYTT